MSELSYTGIGTIVAALSLAAGLCLWSLRRIRFMERHRIVRLRQVRKELQHGP
ncbi:MAG: hypothetical protein GX595_07270 [Lentisphaerae bacterium]|nr:hypothetical protein [Lentisphaerota bacterium]